MAAHMVTCRVCKQKFDTNAGEINVDWIMPTKNFYYHKNCYETWKVADELDAHDWLARIFDLLRRDLKYEYNYQKCEAQFNGFLKKQVPKMTAKGIFFAVKYFYEVKHGDWKKAEGGIGIVPYVYNESSAYWTEQERRQHGLLEAIERQMRALENREKITIQKKKTEQNKSRFKYNLDDV